MGFPVAGKIKLVLQKKIKTIQSFSSKVFFFCHRLLVCKKVHKHPISFLPMFFFVTDSWFAKKFKTIQFFLFQSFFVTDSRLAKKFKTIQFFSSKVFLSQTLDHTESIQLLGPPTSPTFQLKAATKLHFRPD